MSDDSLHEDFNYVSHHIDIPLRFTIQHGKGSAVIVLGDMQFLSLYCFGNLGYYTYRDLQGCGIESEITFITLCRM